MPVMVGVDILFERPQTESLPTLPACINGAQVQQRHAGRVGAYYSGKVASSIGGQFVRKSKRDHSIASGVVVVIIRLGKNRRTLASLVP